MRKTIACLALMLLAGCGPALPPGTLELRVFYAGPHKIMNWSWEEWASGKPVKPPVLERQVVQFPPEARATLLLQLNESRAAQKDAGYPLHGELFQGSGWGGGGTTAGGSVPLKIPPLPEGLGYVLSSAATEGPDGRPTLVGAVFKHRAAIVTAPGETPEQVAARVDWALLFRVHASP